jgi:PhnB protein
MALYPYLNFGTNCRDAFTRYQEIFGGELTIMNASDMPSDEPVPDGMSADLVIHASLRFPNGDLLMASDTGDASFGPVTGMYVCHAVPDTGEAKRVFDALAEGGTVEMPIAETFFSPMFGVCVDRFGTPWMVDTETGETSP